MLSRLSLLCLGAAILSGAAAAEPVDLGFLSGSWTIHDGTGEKIGWSRIEEQADNAVLFEIRTIGDKEGQPLWFVNSEQDGDWEQLFLGPAGAVRAFKAQSQAGAWPMILGSTVTLKDGTPAQFRMTISKTDDAHTRRVLEMSKDGGATWATVFDYDYRRKT